MKKHLNSLIILGLSVGATAIALSTIASHPFTSRQVSPIVQPAQAVTQTKPTIVQIHADWCSACQTLKPIVESLQAQYQGRANFVVLDVTDRNAAQASAAKARQFGVESFFNANRSQTALIAVINDGQVTQQFRKEFNRDNYVRAIDQAISNSR